MANINKVVINGRVRIDLTSDTVKEESLISGSTAHNSAGNKITGSIPVRSKKDVYITNKAIVIPAGYYSENLQINFGEWEWDPFNFETDLVIYKEPVVRD